MELIAQKNTVQIEIHTLTIINKDGSSQYMQYEIRTPIRQEMNKIKINNRKKGIEND